MLNKKEIEYFISILERENSKLENNISFFKSTNKEEQIKQEQIKQEIKLIENKETIKKLRLMLDQIIILENPELVLNESLYNFNNNSEVRCKYCNTIMKSIIEDVEIYGDDEFLCEHCGAIAQEVFGHGLHWIKNNKSKNNF